MFWVVPVEEGGIEHDWEVTLDFGEEAASKEEVDVDSGSENDDASIDDADTDEDVHPEDDEGSMEEVESDGDMDSEESSESDDSIENGVEIAPLIEADFEVSRALRADVESDTDMGLWEDMDTGCESGSEEEDRPADFVYFEEQSDSSNMFDGDE